MKTSINQLVSDLQSLIAEDHIDSAIEKLKVDLDSYNVYDLLQEAILWQSRYNRLCNQARRGTVSQNEFDARKNILIQSLLELIQQIQKSNILPTGALVMRKSLSFNDRKKLAEEMNQFPAWMLGGVNGERGVLLAAGLPTHFVVGFPLSGMPITDTQLVISDLEKHGHLDNRPEYYALGALVEYLLENTPHVEGKLFLAYLLEHYQLITDLDYLQALREKYQLLQTPAEETVELGWDIEQPPFTWQGPDDVTQAEAIWSKKAPFIDAVFLEKGARVARAVCIVETLSSQGTGFLIAPNLILTNHHVVPTDEQAKSTQIRFGYRMDESGHKMPGKAYQVIKAIKRSPMNLLDYVVLEAKGAPGEDSQIGYLDLAPKFLSKEERLYIIQHPLGQPQKLVLQDNCITYVSDDHHRVQYLTNTRHGSSGSPVCNGNWDVVALHHSGAPLPSSSKTAKIQGNEGIPMKAILPEIHDLL